MVRAQVTAWSERRSQAGASVVIIAAPSSSTARQQICRAALLATTVIRTCGIARELDCSADEKPYESGTLSPGQDRQARKRYPG